MPSDSEDDTTTSNTSKKREREGDNVAKRNKKMEMDKSMETDEEIAIVGVKAGVAKKTGSEKKHHPRMGSNATRSMENGQPQIGQ